MTLFSSGNRPGKVITLNDMDGTDSLHIKNSAGFTVAKIDSQGNLKKKGKDIKI